MPGVSRGMALIEICPRVDGISHEARQRRRVVPASGFKHQLYRGSVGIRDPGVRRYVGARLQQPSIPLEVGNDVSPISEAVHDIGEVPGMREAERVTAL